jgi:2-oxoglutarate ferredoxin oxidoreductase subunit delta
MTLVTDSVLVNPSPPIPPDATVRWEQDDATLVVRRAYCKGCRLCIDACPAGILELDEVDRLVVRDIARCMFCGACAGRCPDFVFVLERGSGADRP